MRYTPLAMIKSITLTNIRNFSNKHIEFKETNTNIYGPNGSGKTTILESIHAIATTKSHKASEEKEMIKDGKPFGKITLIDDTHTYEMVITTLGKRVWLDKQEKKKLSNFIGHLHIVLFAPEDIDLIKGNPQFKRQFLDVSMIQLDNPYIQKLSLYKQLLKQRNALLKRLKLNDDETFLNVLNDQLIEVGKEIIKARENFIERLNQVFNEICQSFQLVDAKVVYRPSVHIEKYAKSIQDSKQSDILSKTTNVGPHRDDFSVSFNQSIAKQYASQGQARLLALALKMAVYTLLKQANKKVTLLLDDVLSELDIDNQKKVLELRTKDSQVILNSAIRLHHKNENDIELKGEFHE